MASAGRPENILNAWGHVDAGIVPLTEGEVDATAEHLHVHGYAETRELLSEEYCDELKADTLWFA